MVYIVMIHACNRQQLSSWEEERPHRKLPGPELLLAAGTTTGSWGKPVCCQPWVPSWPLAPHCGKVVCWFLSFIGIKSIFLSHSSLPSLQLLDCVISNCIHLPEEGTSFLADLPLLLFAHISPLLFPHSCPSDPQARFTQIQNMFQIKLAWLSLLISFFFVVVAPGIFNVKQTQYNYHNPHWEVI